MSDRAALLKAFVGQTIWQDWEWVPVTGDASRRRYWRLSRDHHSVVLMDDDPSLGGSTTKFVKIAQLLLSAGLQAPQILAHDHEKGFMIISDLGATDVATWLRRSPQDENQLYQMATQVLVALHGTEAPQDLERMTPAVGASMIDLTGPYYALGDVSDLTKQVQLALSEHAPHADTLALRDFHAENLIWRDRHIGLDQIGILDFQDAVLAPAGYDLVSLLTDARRDVSPQTAQNMTDHFIDAIQAGPEFTAQLACLSIQRNLRILGIFGRLSLCYGKPKYLELVPRVWGYIEKDIAHPALGTLRQAVLDSVPAPTPNVLERLQP